jgi:perosamine synthetase
MKISFFHTNISSSSISNVNQVLSTTFISAGSKAEEFEKKLESSLKIINPVSLNSGTSALHLGLTLAGVGPGDEVILPAQTFIATGLVVLMLGAKPVFADIQLDSGNIDPESIYKKISPRTKAIIPVHWSGYPCDMDEICEIAQKHNLSVLEDAAHAIGSYYKGKPIGTLSRFTAFSFQAIKHLTTGDGGLLCCLNHEDYYRAKRLRWFDIDRDNSKSTLLGERQYDAENIGFKYHMNDLAASIGLGNLENLYKILEHHRSIAKKYETGLKNIPGLTQMKYKNDRLSSYWFYQLKVENRDGFIRSLKEEGFPVSVVHQRIDRNAVFGGVNTDLVNQGIFNDVQIALPIHMGMNMEDIDSIIQIIQKGW